MDPTGCVQVGVEEVLFHAQSLYMCVLKTLTDGHDSNVNIKMKSAALATRVALPLIVDASIIYMLCEY